MKSEKKIPLRTCVGCRQQKEKKQLIRIVKETEGGISFDPTGRKNGRGAYVCRSVSCVDAARKNHGLEKSFQCRITEDIWERLLKEMGSIEE